MNRICRVSIVTGLIGAGLILTGMMGACSREQAPPVADNVRNALNQAGLKDVSVSQDKTKGVVTLTGHVPTEADKTNADRIAQSQAAGQVVANEIAILPDKDAGPTKTMYGDLDKGIGSNLDAALIAAGFKKGISHSVKNGVVTLTGTVNDEAQRAQLETVAKGVPNVQQVVNEVQTRHQKATTTK